MGRIYRKKPDFVEAIQWKGDNFIEIDDFISVPHETYPSQGIIKIPMPDGIGILKVGKNEFYPCAPDVFSKTYDKL